MRISSFHALTAMLLTAGATTAIAQQTHQPSLAISSTAYENMEDVYGKPKTRSEVRADLKLWQRAGLEELRKGENTPDTFSDEYREAYAEYVRMHSGSEYQDELKRQSAM